MRDQNWWYTNGPLEFLLGSKCNPDVNVADSKEIRPIHLAATLSERRVRRMLNEGADSKALTIEGQSAVSEGQSKMIDRLDEEGRTALHYACRSGRIESVKILLDIDADPNATDHKGRTPLDACAEFPEEDYRWRLEPTEGTRTRFMDEAYVTLGDQHRPKEKDYSHDMSEHDTVRMGQIIRLLLAHGADISTNAPKSQSFPYNS
ncbi:hypothetical protein OEA41_008568 [Lepraria neglecta]|uniref:Ankyrin n=1 Tax=Lepraria neglecta TaxID=209136 RepID=A0AAE0DP92_9LECA|nr:hypothetical protein OEA41_008568 [Lepraria neglecta]